MITESRVSKAGSSCLAKGGWKTKFIPSFLDLNVLMEVGKPHNASPGVDFKRCALFPQ